MIIRKNVPLSSLTTMRLGGPARFLIEVESPSDVPKAYAFAAEHSLPVFVLGGGANTIAGDAGFDGVILKNTMVGITSHIAPESSSTIIEALGGTEWDAVVAYSVKRGLTGIEALSKIPGLAGAAPVQNIGAYGQDISQTFLSADVYDTHSGTFKTLSKSDFAFSYRHSILNTTEAGRYFVISIKLALASGSMPRPFYNSVERYIADHKITDFSPASIRAIVSIIRADKLPDPRDKASSGSFFKNIYLSESAAASAEAKGYPVYRGHDGLKINSGWLIEQAGLKGQLLHGMRVSSKAALVLINESAASYRDLATARAEIINTIKSKFGYTLEQEPVEIPSPKPNPKKPGRPASKTKILDGSELAGFVKERQAHQVASLTHQPTLLIIRDSDNPVITKYVDKKIAYGADIGVKVIDYLASSTDDIRSRIVAANSDDSIDGIILQLPILEKSATDSLTSLIAPAKDVDGLSGSGHYDSATATAVNWLLAGYDITLPGAKIALVGRGKLVGAPLFKMFTSSGYDVSLFHRGDDLTKLKNFDIIISATGVPGLISDDMVSPGATLIDAGTASEKGVLRGDVSDAVRARTDLAAITPIVGGVGPLTVSCLFDHTIEAAIKAEAR